MVLSYIIDGYLYSKCKEHHFRVSNGCVAQHRLVWEQANNAILLPWADVHHINGIKTDNRPENLEAMTHKKHVSKHKKGNIIRYDRSKRRIPKYKNVYRSRYKESIEYPEAIKSWNSIVYIVNSLMIS